MNALMNFQYFYLQSKWTYKEVTDSKLITVFTQQILILQTNFMPVLQTNKTPSAFTLLLHLINEAMVEETILDKFLLL